MQVSSTLSEQEVNNLQNEFYKFFKTGYAFEEFLKEYLKRMGLDEVQVTQRSCDGGIDLTAIRKGVGDFSEIDTTYYYVQAKRNNPKTKVSVQKIRELKGTIPFGHKGLFITTSDFTNDAAKEAVNDPSKPIVAINGKALVMSCIDNQIGFLFKPVFSKLQMELFVYKHEKETSANEYFYDIADNYIEKLITANDIRARIVSIPSAIIKQFDVKQEKTAVIINGDKHYEFNIVRGRNYFGGVTNFLREYKLLSEDGVITPKQSKWHYNKENRTVEIYIEN